MGTRGHWLIPSPRTSRLLFLFSSSFILASLAPSQLPGHTVIIRMGRNHQPIILWGDAVSKNCGGLWAKSRGLLCGGKLWSLAGTLELKNVERASLNSFGSTFTTGLPGNVWSFGLELLVQVLLSHLAWSYIQPQGSSGKSKLQLNPEGSCKSLSKRGKKITQRKGNEIDSENNHSGAI